MSETIITAIIAACATLAVSVITQITTFIGFKFKSKDEITQEAYKTKRDNLCNTYRNIISIINLYPSISPNDFLMPLEFPPYYSLENFDAVLITLDYQIEDYIHQLEMPSIEAERKSSIEVEISNRKALKKKISEIRDKYNEAKSKYDYFCEFEKVDFELYAGRDVKNCLVSFEVTIHNVFISGRSSEDPHDVSKNIIDISRRQLINSMRHDIGIDL